MILSVGIFHASLAVREAQLQADSAVPATFILVLAAGKFTLPIVSHGFVSMEFGQTAR